MNNFVPVNRHIWIDLPQAKEEQSESGILLPDDYKPKEEKYGIVQVLEVSRDCSIECSRYDEVIVDKKMIDEITVDHETYNVILENYVVGILKKDKNNG